MQFATSAVFAERAAVSDITDELAANPGLPGETLVICTPGGFVVVKLDSDGQRLPEDSTFYPGCQWCQPFSGTAAVPAPEQPGLTLPIARDFRYGVTASQIPPRSVSGTAFHSRAPPPLRLA